MQKTVLRTVLVVLAFAFALAGTAYAVKFELDGMVISATAEIEPRELPGPGDSGKPVTLSTVVRVSSKDGSAPLSLSQILLKLDRFGTVDTRGLPVCTQAKLAGAKPAEARKRCAGAIVGTGTGRADVRLPGKAPAQIQSPLTFFNGPPQDGKPTLIAHAWETLPSPKAVLVPIVVERIKNGRYGYRAEIDLPPIAEGYGAATLAEATIGTTWKRGGKEASYIDANCAGGRLQVFGKLTFADGSVLPSVLASPCHEPR